MKTSKHNQVGNFEKLVSFTNAQGAVYNPGKASIKNAALQTLLTQAQGAIHAADVSRTAYVNALNARTQLMQTIPKTATRIIGSLQASGVSKETMESCKAIKRRFHTKAKKNGNTLRSVSPSAEGVPNGVSVASRSTAQSDIDSVIANFEKLVVMATSDPLYTPNEVELQAEGLQTYINTIREKNTAVKTTRATMKEADRIVSSLLFTNTGIYGQAQSAKGYIKSLYGFSSNQFKEVSNIKFRTA